MAHSDFYWSRTRLLRIVLNSADFPSTCMTGDGGDVEGVGVLVYVVLGYWPNCARRVLDYICTVHNAQNREAPEWDYIWDLLNQEKGVRILSYAFLILFPANITNRLVSYRKVEIIQKYATNADWWRALLFYSTHFTWLFITVIGVASVAFDTGAETYR